MGREDLLFLGEAEVARTIVELGYRCRGVFYAYSEDLRVETMSGVEWNILEIPIYARLIGIYSRFQNSEIQNEKCTS